MNIVGKVHNMIWNYEWYLDKRIFIKFETKAVSLHINQGFDFHDEPCMYARARKRQKRAQLFISVRMRMLDTYVRVRARIIVKINFSRSRGYKN